MKLSIQANSLVYRLSNYDIDLYLVAISIYYAENRMQICRYYGPWNERWEEL